MVDEPDGKNEKPNPDQPQSRIRLEGNLTLVYQHESEKNGAKSADPKTTSGDVSTAHKIWEWIVSSSFWTALATAVIAGFTVALYCVSTRQWKTMDRQLRDSEIAQAASLSIKGLQIADFPKSPRIVFDLKNAGPTRADRVTLMIGNGTVDPAQELRFFCGPLAETGLGTIQPNANGFSISQSDQRHFEEPIGGMLFDPEMQKHLPRGTEERALADILGGKSDLYVNVVASYRDLFGNALSTADCVVYKSGHFSPC